MHIYVFKHPLQVAATIFSLIVTGASLTSTAWSAGLDLDEDGMSDVWQRTYNIFSSDSLDDPDGDGENNLQEARAGTNPHDATSHSRITIRPWTNGPLMLEWQGIERKKYNVQAASPGSTTWSNVSPTLNGEGIDLSFPHPLSGAGGFLRVGQSDDSDIDSDNLYDWEEALLGSDPEDSDTDNDGLLDATDDDPLRHTLGVGLPVMSTNLNVTGPGWSFNNGSDAPEGAYLALLHAGITSRTAVINLGYTLTPGRYNVFVKVIDYDKHGRVDISLGGGTGSLITNDRDPNRYWTESVPIDVTSPADTITLTFVKLIPASSFSKLLFRGLLISPDPDITIQNQDVAVKLTMPLPEEYDESPPTKGNLLENSSFEVGVGHGWGLSSGDWPESRRNLTIRDALDTNDSFHGSASIKLPLSGQAGAITLISKAYRFKPNKEYTLSAYVRSGGKRKVTFGFYNTFDTPAGFPKLNDDDFTTQQISSTNWERISFKARMLEYPTSDYLIKFRAHGSGCLWIDAIQIEEGDLSPYAPRNNLEVGIDTEAPSHIFHEGDSLEMQLHTYRDKEEPTGSTIGYVIYNYLNQVVGGGTTSIPNVAGRFTSSVSLPSLRGFLRCYAWVIGEDGTEDELSYTLVPPPRQPGRTIHAVNTGGPRYVARDGTVFETDTYFVGGGTAETTNLMTNTMDDFLYQSERHGNFSYRFPVTNGSYFVKLYFAEISYTAPGQRQFDLFLEDTEVISDLDVYATSGTNDRAYTVEFKTTVSDGFLDVNVNADIDQAKISAIKITTLGDLFSPFNSLLGCHAHHTGFQLEALQRLGFRWNHVYSPASWCRWSIAEPSEGDYNWFDGFVDRAIEHDILMLANIGDKTPAWARRTYFTVTNVTGSGFMVGETLASSNTSAEISVVLTDEDVTGHALQLLGSRPFANGQAVTGTVSGTTATINSSRSIGSPALDKWENFVETVVRHYDGRIHHWEIWNEPIHVPKQIPNVAFYAELVKRAAIKIHEVSEQQRVVVMGASQQGDWFESIIDLYGDSWKNYIDFGSTHSYPGNEPRIKLLHDRIITPHRVPMWNTETGRFNLGSMVGVNANFRAPGEAFFGPIDSERFFDGLLVDAGKVSRNFLFSMGYGLTKYIYYDGRLRGTQDNHITQPSMFEYNDSIRMKGVTLSLVGHFLDYSSGSGEIILSDPKAKAFLFERGEEALVGLYTEKVSLPKTIDLSANLSVEDINVYGLMGNERSLTSPTIQFSQSPLIIKSQELSATELRTAFENGIISDVPDNDPPNLSITVAPRGPTRNRDLRLRWIAIDEISRPDFADPRQIEFRHQLVGLDDEWSTWSAQTYKEYANVPFGNYTLQVEARDAAGNLSSTSRDITVTP